MQTKKSIYVLIVLFSITLISVYTVQSAKAAAVFTAIDQTTLSDSGYVGDTLTLSGTGFPNSVDISVQCSGTELTTAHTDGSGSWTKTFAIPETNGGLYDLEAWVTGDTDPTATTTFTVLPSITLTPSSGPVGDTIIVVGNGFSYDPVGDGLSATWDTFSLTLSTPTNDGSGGNFMATFTVPSSTATTHAVTITSDSDPSIFASAAFTVTTLSVTPEYPLGLLGLAACLVGFVLFVKHKGLNLNSRF